jgi:hypothetical protein
MVLGFKYYTHNLANKLSSSSGDMNESHLPKGHEEDKLLVLNFKEHPHSAQHGCDPGTKHSVPTKSNLGQA